MTRHFIDTARFGQGADISLIKVDVGLLHALIKRRYEETHTFHPCLGEMTVTWGLSKFCWVYINGPPVSDGNGLGQENVNVLDSYPHLLGVVSSREEEVIKNNVTLAWLKTVFDKKKTDLDYILRLVGTFFFPNHKLKYNCIGVPPFTGGLIPNNSMYIVLLYRVICNSTCAK